MISMEEAMSIDTIQLLERGREPLPPFALNVYIAHSLEDSTFVSGAGVSLCKILEEKFNIKCFPRHLEGDNSSIKTRIDEGVLSSEKCLILMTDKYRDDSSSHYEIQQIRDKAKRFSSDTVIVVWPRLREGDEFNSYTNIENIHNLESLCNSNENLSVLARSIIKAPEASLTCLPKINTGYGAATGFFYGFLRLVLPNFRKRFNDAAKEDAMAEAGMLDRTVCKMLIILPLSCFCSMAIADKKGRIKNVENLYVKRWANRAGNIGRDYKSSVYKLVKETTQEVFYFAGELATPLLTMYESYSNGLLCMTLPQLYRERDAFCFTLHQVLNHPNNRECNNQYRLIMWDDRKSEKDGDYNVTLYDRLLPILQEELEKERLESENSTVHSADPAANSQPAEMDCEPAKSENYTTFELVGENQQSIAAFYEKRQFASYPLRHDIRGKALIINIVNFQPSDPTVKKLKKREGGQHDGEKMKRLFEDLGFETAVHVDVNRQRLDSILMMYNSMDHSNYDAFICCIMTHGNLGVIYTSDCLPYGILDIVDMFSSDNCSSLTGKPKLFFVQSCQKGAEQDSPHGSNSALQRDATVDGKLETDADVDDNDRTGGLNSRFEFLSLDPELKACLVPGEPDILMSYSALPGSISYRDPHRGSLYIDALDNNLRKHLEIDRALKKVTKYVDDKLVEHGRQQQVNYTPQLPFHLTTGMSKLLYLKDTSGRETGL